MTALPALSYELAADALAPDASDVADIGITRGALVCIDALGLPVYGVVHRVLRGGSAYIVRCGEHPHVWYHRANAEGVTLILSAAAMDAARELKRKAEVRG